MDLSPDQVRRYALHLTLPEVGVEGQKRLRATSVLCVGAGGLGSPIAMYLAAAGIGRLGIVDFDAVEFSNLQRQILHGTEDLGRPKCRSAQETIQSLNPGVEARVRVAFPEIPDAEVCKIGSLGPSPGELESAKQRALYSDCLRTREGFICHLPRNIDWRHDAWERLCEAKVLVSALRDYPPEEQEVWLKHAKAVQAQWPRLQGHDRAPPR